MANNLTWHTGEVDRAARESAYGHRGATLWFTGFSGSGKSTIAYRTERLLIDKSVFAYVLDGDNVRHGLNADLGFAADDRQENIRRIGEVSRLFTDAGALVLSAFISPYRADRARVRDLVGDRFIEVHVATPLEVCEARDPKGLYKKARAGEIGDFTGISAPYEEPQSPEIRLDTTVHDVNACAQQVVAYLEQQGFVGGGL